MSLHITGPESGQLSKAIQSAFVDVMLFQRVLTYKLDMNVSDVASPYVPFPEVLFNVIRHYNARYEIDKFVLALLEYNPSNEKLLEFGWKKRILQSRTPTTTAAGEAEPLERFLDPQRGYTDPMAFLRRFSQITRCVCRISVGSAAGTCYGTGLLIGDSTILTNYHVVQSLVENRPGSDPQQVECLFDYHTDIDGATITKGVPFKLASSGTSWLIDASPYDPSDLKVRTVAENVATDRPADKLDYAVLRLADAPGELPLGQRNEMGSENRGHIPLPADAEQRFAGDFELQTSAVFIFQHPNSQPLRMDWQKPGVLGVNANSTRVMYDVNTQPGSSGSPCFNSRLELMALHHAGGKDWPAESAYLYNQGIPIYKIYQALSAKNKLGEIR